MPKNRHLTFGDMQAQKAREEQLAKLRAMMKPVETSAAETSEPAPAAGSQPTTGATTPAKPAAKPAPKKKSSKSTAKKVTEKKSTSKRSSAKSSRRG